MSNPKEVAKGLLKTAQEHNVRFPKIWSEVQLIQDCGGILMANRTDGQFDLAASLEALIAKHGVEKTAEPQGVGEAPAESKKRKSKKEKKNDDEAEEETGEDTEEEQGKKKKEKKELAVAVEANRPIADVILEMGAIYFRNGDARKGGVFSKAAKAVREAESEITTAKEAMKLKGIGKGIAAYIEEFLETKMIVRLEELRAGTA